MPKKSSTPTPIPLSISSPILRSPDAAYFREHVPSPSPRSVSAASPRPGNGPRDGSRDGGKRKGEDEIDGLGFEMGGFDDVSLSERASDNQITGFIFRFVALLV